MLIVEQVLEHVPQKFNLESYRLWSFGAESWFDPGTLGPWDPGTLGPWDPSAKNWHGARKKVDSCFCLFKKRQSDKNRWKPLPVSS